MVCGTAWLSNISVLLCQLRLSLRWMAFLFSSLCIWDSCFKHQAELFASGTHREWLVVWKRNEMLHTFIKWLYYLSQLGTKGNTWRGLSSPKARSSCGSTDTELTVCCYWGSTPSWTRDWEHLRTSAQIKTSSCCLHAGYHALATKKLSVPSLFPLFLHCSITLGRASFYYQWKCAIRPVPLLVSDLSKVMRSL